jgi:hypothetical protein
MLLRLTAVAPVDLADGPRHAGDFRRDNLLNAVDGGQS